VLVASSVGAEMPVASSVEAEMLSRVTTWAGSRECLISTGRAHWPEIVSTSVPEDKTVSFNVDSSV
jgi:hypothetical protein